MTIWHLSGYWVLKGFGRLLGPCKTLMVWALRMYSINFQESFEYYLGLFVGALSRVTFSSISLPKQKQRYVSEITGSYTAIVSLIHFRFNPLINGVYPATLQFFKEDNLYTTYTGLALDNSLTIRGPTVLDHLLPSFFSFLFFLFSLSFSLNFFFLTISIL